MTADSSSFNHADIVIDESTDLLIPPMSGSVNTGLLKSPAKAPKAGFVPLSELMEQTPLEQFWRLSEAANKAEREKLINAFQTAFSAKKRLAALTLADSLIRRGIPPIFWHSHLSITRHDINQKSDLIIFDLRWIRKAHPEHIGQVRYQRYRDIFTPNEAKFNKAAEYIFYGGNRDPWKITASLSLNDVQQFEMYRLKSTQVSKRQLATNAMRDEVFSKLKAHINGVQRKKTFTDEDARCTLFRRHRLWLCSRMTSGKAFDICRRYEQLTGDIISLDIVRRQLTIVGEIINTNRTTKQTAIELL